MLDIPLFSSPPRYRTGRKPTGAKLALKPVHVWGIRIRCVAKLPLRHWFQTDCHVGSPPDIDDRARRQRPIGRCARDSRNSGFAIEPPLRTGGLFLGLCRAGAQAVDGAL